MPQQQDYSDMTVRELEEEARGLGVSGYSSMKKDELVAALEKHGKMQEKGTSSGEKSRASGSGKYPGVLALLKEEHDEVKQLFDSFEQQAESDIRGAALLVDRILEELTRHAEMEEQIVYPGLQEEDDDVYREAHEEHHVAELLMGEIAGMQPDGTYKAKVIVLAENVRHHIEEEEVEGFKELKKLPPERLEQMATQWQEMKAQWKGKPARAARKAG